MRHTRAAIAGLLLFVCATVTAQQTISSSSGVYTPDQAAAGEKIYFAQCSSCHGDDLAGRETARICVSCLAASSRCRLPPPIACRPPTRWPCSRSCSEAPRCRAERRRCRSIADNWPGLRSNARAVRRQRRRPPQAAEAQPAAPVGPAGRLPDSPRAREAARVRHRRARDRTRDGLPTAATSPATAIHQRTRSRRTTSLSCASPGA